MKTVKFILLLLMPLLFACTPKQYFEEEGTIFHTVYHIKYEAKSSMIDSIDAELQKVDQTFNTFNDQSQISLVNGNMDIAVNDWFVKVFRCAEKVSENTGGRYDITCAPFVNLWGFGFNRKDSVTAAVIDSLHQFVGYEKIRLKGHKVIKEDPRTLLDCSSVAKGFASDAVADLFERHGIDNYMIEIGGEVAMNGKNKLGEGWRIGIDKPIDDSTGVVNEVQEVVQLNKKGGIATSGNYRNFYIKEGKKYAHTIDPLTGFPAEQDILSATIVAPDCMTADAYATAFMVLGLDRARALKAKVPEIEYFVIYTDSKGLQKIDYSDGMIEYLPNRKQLAILEKP